MRPESSSSSTVARDRLIVALDVDSRERALRLVDELRDHVGAFKVGLELVWSAGFGIVGDIASAGGRVFVDSKLHDIPNTVRGAAQGLGRLPVTMFNVHASGGVEMVKAAVQGGSEGATRAGHAAPAVLGVTVLTSIDETILRNELKVPMTPLEQVLALTRVTVAGGAQGVIASPNEARHIREMVPSGFMIVTPGIRPSWAAAQDQKRIATPSEAIRNGATHLVVGRPITAPPPEVGGLKRAAELVTEEIDAALRHAEA